MTRPSPPAKKRRRLLRKGHQLQFQVIAQCSSAPYPPQSSNQTAATSPAPSATRCRARGRPTSRYTHSAARHGEHRPRPRRRAAARGAAPSPLSSPPCARPRTASAPSAAPARRRRRTARARRRPPRGPGRPPASGPSRTRVIILAQLWSAALLTRLRARTFFLQTNRDEKRSGNNVHLRDDHEETYSYS